MKPSRHAAAIRRPRKRKRAQTAATRPGGAVAGSGSGNRAPEWRTYLMRGAIRGDEGGGTHRDLRERQSGGSQEVIKRPCSLMKPCSRGNQCCTHSSSVPDEGRQSVLHALVISARAPFDDPERKRSMSRRLEQLICHRRVEVLCHARAKATLALELHLQSEHHPIVIRGAREAIERPSRGHPEAKTNLERPSRLRLCLASHQPLSHREEL